MPLAAILVVTDQIGIGAHVLYRVDEVPLVEVWRRVLAVVDVHEPLSVSVVGQQLLGNINLMRFLGFLDHIKYRYILGAFHLIE